ncbi:MAG: MBL fold metallo-hydrolase [Clostridia bacterium]|nr:MBL fold metallo-hydrolase [Clostridia bacterium]
MRKKRLHGVRKGAAMIMRAVFIALVAAMLLVLLYGYFTNRLGVRYERNGTSVTFFNVGQGDSALFLTEDAAILFDAGPFGEADDTVMSIKMRTDKLDCIVISHPHEDHMGALAAVLGSVKTDRIIMTSDSSEGVFFTRALDVIERKGIPVTEAKAGDEYVFGDVRLEFFSPTEYTDDKNENSAVVRASAGDFSVLFTGDASKETEKGIIERYGDRLRSDVLKVGHHGSSASTSAEFLAAVSPRAAVISCGLGNSYSHPHASTLNRLTDCGAQIFRTDLDGEITVRIEDGKLNVTKR